MPEALADRLKSCACPHTECGCSVPSTTEPLPDGYQICTLQEPPNGTPEGVTRASSSRLRKSRCSTLRLLRDLAAHSATERKHKSQWLSEYQSCPKRSVFLSLNSASLKIPLLCSSASFSSWTRGSFSPFEPVFFMWESRAFSIAVTKAWAFSELD